MRNLFLLLKNNFNILLGTLQKNKQRKSTLSASVLLVVGIVAIVAVYTSQAISMFEGLGEIGMGGLCIFHACVTSVSVVVIIGTMRISTNTKTNDADLLLSIPIKKRDIVISKTISKYIFDLFFVLLLLMPYIVVYQFKVAKDVSMLLMGVLILFLLPLLSVAISYLLDFLVNRIYKKSRYGNALKSITIVAIFIVIMALMLTKTSLYGTVGADGLQSYIEDRPFSYLIYRLLLDTKLVDILVFLAITIIPFILSLILYAVDFGKPLPSYRSKKKDLDFSKNNSTLGLLFKKEIRGYLTTPAYLINTIIGPILMIVLSVFLATTGKDGLVSLLGIPAFSNEVVAGIIAVVFGLLSGTATISASSISLEGKNIWLLKSSPIKLTSLFLSKVFTHLVVVLPVEIISSILIGITFNFNILSWGIILLLPILHTVMVAFLGLLINLFLPKMDWDDEVKVVKQSIAVLVGMIFGALFGLLPVGVYYLFDTLQVEYIALISACIYIVVLIVILILLKKLGRKLFQEL